MSLNVVKMSQKGKSTEFDESNCRVRNSNGKVVAVAMRSGSLYYLDCQHCEMANVVVSNEDLWHRRYGHLNSDSLKRLSSEDLVDGFSFDAKKGIAFCDACVHGKHHKTPFPVRSETRAKGVLDLVHSDVCGKLRPKSIGGAEYFVTFIDDRSRYVWLYMMKSKSEVFSKFKQWKAMVEKSTGRQLKALRSDNGGEYTSTEFTEFLRSEGIRHERSVPKNPQQNGVAECFNRTLIEMTRSMLSGSDMSKSFWAEAISTAAYLRNRTSPKLLRK